MTSTEQPAAGFIRQAEEARRAAAQAKDERIRQGFLDIAKQWEALAEAENKKLGR